jgi:hypothetical protein
MARIIAGFTGFIYRFLKNFSNSMDMHSLKKLSDSSFILGEKILVNFPFFIEYYTRFYKEMVENEIQMTNITSKDNILHIGCGPIPATSILISEKTGAKVVAIDKALKSVKKAEYLVKNYFKSDNLEVICADGLVFPTKDFDVIILSDGINKLDEILSNISKMINCDTRIIFRKNIYSPDDLNEDNFSLARFFQVKKVCNHKSYGYLSSVLLLKKHI